MNNLYCEWTGIFSDKLEETSLQTNWQKDKKQNDKLS